MKKNTKKFLERFLICFIAYVLFVSGIMVALASMLDTASLAVKIIVGVSIALLFVVLVVVVEASHRKVK